MTTNTELINSLPESIFVDWDHETREIHLNGKLLRPNKSWTVRNHSPDGFNVGYGGSGPAQLALAILLNYMPKEDASSLYQSFKFAVIASWPQHRDFELTLNLKQEIEKIIIKQQT